MKVINLIHKLSKVSAPPVAISVKRTDWGWFVKGTTQIGRYYDIEITEQVRDRMHAMTEAQIHNAFVNSEQSYFNSKPYHDESDMMTDYCAWSFNHRVKDVDYLASSAASNI